MGSVSQVKEGTTCETTKQVVEKWPAHRTRRHDKSALHPTAAEQGFGREGGEWFGNNYFHLCRSYWPYYIFKFIECSYLIFTNPYVSSYLWDR